MKKILLAVMAVAAIGFTSCNNKTNPGTAIDSTDVAAELTDASAIAKSEAESLTATLTEKLAAADPATVQELLEQAKSKIAELVAKGDTEAAQAYKEVIDGFISNNAEQLKAVAAGNEALSTLVTTVTALPTDAAAAADAAKTAVEDAAANKVNEVKTNAAQTVNDAVETQRTRANDAIDNAAAEAKKKLGL